MEKYIFNNFNKDKLYQKQKPPDEVAFKNLKKSIFTLLLF